MNRLWSGGRLALLLFVLALTVAGCVPSGAATDTGWTTLTIAGTELYAVRSTGEAVALNLQGDGALIWRYPLETAATGPGCGIMQKSTTGGEASLALGAVFSPPAVSDGLVLFGSSEEKLIALDAESGKPAWSYPVDSAVIGGVAVAEGIAYFGTVSGQVYAVDLEAQKPAWETTYTTGDRVWSTPLVDGSRLYVASMDHRIHALDRSSGESLWSADLGGAIQGDIALYHGVLYAGGVDRRLYAIEAESGRVLWKTDRLDSWIWGAPLQTGDMVCFATLDGKVHGHSVQSGKPVWAPVTLQGGISAGPARVGDSAVVGTDEGMVYLIDLEAGSAEVLYGSLPEQQRGGYLSTITVHDDIVYLGSSYGFVVALDPAARAPEAWVYPSPEAE